MRSIKELAPKPSDAITAMIEGLKEQSQRKDFEVYMRSFGHYSEVVEKCFGCAATCSLQKLLQKNFTQENIGDRTFGLPIEFEELRAFEDAIDSLRRGSERALARYYSVGDINVEPKEKLLFLQDHNWEERLWAYEAYRDQLKSIGL